MLKLRLHFFLLLTLLLPAVAFAQVKIYGPAPAASQKKVNNKNARTQTIAIAPRTLPFWDDFSTAQGHPADSLWIVNNTVFVNSGQGINPPTLNVATFDGYNQNGLPYSNVPLETGYTDVLESQPILLADIVPADRDDIYLSFFYQPGGNSEMPNPGDFLRLEFNSTKGWREIKTFRVKPTSDPTVFYDTAIQVPARQIIGNDTIEYYHDEFQFRFVSFGRRSGAYDAWHLDYVYLNKRIFNDRNTNISDRALTQPLTSVFGEYTAIPYTHFKLDPDDYFGDMSFEVFNLKDTTFNQVLNYAVSFDALNYENEVFLASHENNSGILSTDEELPPRTRRSELIPTKPEASNFEDEADSVSLVVRFVLGSGDQKLPSASPPGDYYQRYRGIDFRHNDTIEQVYTLSKYYAYDDGEAEYAAGLAIQGNQLAYRFTMPNIEQDTLNGLDIYFPFFGGTTPANMEISLFRDDNGKPEQNEFYSQLVNITRTANNLFSRINFSEGIIVRDTFYIGYLETQNGEPDRIRIGLDASNDTGEHVFYRNTYLHPWVQNTTVKGSFMIRPRFGKATVITGIEDEPRTTFIYPNPNQGEFYLKGSIHNLQVISVTGQPVRFSLEDSNELHKVTLHATSPGLYLVRYQSGTKFYTDKILVTSH